MAKSISQVSRRYANALVRSAEQQKLALDDVVRALESLAAAFETSEELKNVVLNPAFSKVERTKVLSRIATQAGLPKSLQSFVQFVLERGRLALISEIRDAVKEARDRQSGTITAEVHTVKPLTAAQSQRLKKALEKRIQKTVELVVHENLQLVGGLRIQVGTHVFDGTVSAQLQALSERLMAAQA